MHATILFSLRSTRAATLRRALGGSALALAVLARPALGAAAAPTFSPDSLRATVAFLADDRLEGRGSGSAGLDSAGRYLAARFAAAGLRPAGDNGTYFQEFEATIGVRPEGENSMRVGEHELVFQTDWNAYGFSGTGTTRGPLVFAGYGIKAPEYDYDDYVGLDVKGKVVIVLRHEPGKDDSTSAFEGKTDTPHANPRHKAILAREQGAAGILLVTGPLSDESDRLVKLRADAGYYSTEIACGQVTRDKLAAVLPGFDLRALQEKIDTTGKPASTAIEGAEIEWKVGLAKERTQLRNVLGLVPGKNPNRYLVIGAHYDHLGLGGESSLAPDERTPHNGADDNASGTAALVALAGHFAGGPQPPISMLFAAFSGEEIGLAGSDYYVKHPTMALDSTCAMLNMDMVGRLRDRKLTVFGSDTAKEFGHLLEVLNAQGPKFELRLKGDGYGPSDQMSFFKKNVPVLHFFTGAHSDYHKPSDDTATLDYQGLSEVAAFVGEVAEATMEQPLTFVAATGPAPGSGDSGGGGFRSRLGAIPDYGQAEDIKGVVLTGVRADSPAEKAGLQGGDIIVQMGTTTVNNIYDMVHVLQTHNPGDAIEVVVLRNGERVAVQAVLGAAQ